MACIDRVCRLCLAETPPSDSDGMVPLNDNSEALLHLIRIVTTVEVILDHECQYFMCGDCNNTLEKSYAFRERCIVNDEIYRRKFPATQHIVTESCVFIPVNIMKPCNDSSNDENSRTEQLQDEKNFIEECLVEDVQQDDDKDVEPLYEEREVAQSQSTDSEAMSSKTPRKGRKPRVRKIKAESDKSNNKLPCSQCGKMIARNNINQHLLTHDPDRPKVFCSYCGKAFKDPRRMQLHINSNHTLEKKYPCDICGRVYLRPTSLKDHQATKHTTDKRYECTECGQAFTSWAQRWHHFKKEHTTAKPYACTYCDWAFKFKGDLTLHIRKHTGEKPFKCDICGKAFNKSYNVVIHKKSHRNMLPSEGVVSSEVGTMQSFEKVEGEGINLIE